MRDKIIISETITQEKLMEKLLKSDEDSFKIALLFNSYFKREKELLVNNLISSERRDEDIGTINYLGFLITKINQIQEKRDEG